VRNQVTFAFWLRRSRDGSQPRPLDPIPADYRWNEQHLYVAGLLEFARAYQEARGDYGQAGLFLVGEHREEMGTLRGRVATNLNRFVFTEKDTEANTCRALTADVGLRVLISRGRDPGQGSEIRVLCTTCDLDNDRTDSERLHRPAEINEVAIKGENEGVFYNCTNHNPAHHGEPIFLERVERYDVFANDSFRR
jgi:hypothetical protein